jgi:hypothetical protein
MKNPFIYGPVVSGDQFLDRESEVSQITRALLSGQNIICYSPRRYGKTSMMMRIKEELAAKGHLVFFIDLFRVTSLEDLYTIYATSIVEEIRSPIKALIETIQNILPSINPKIVITSQNAPTVEVSVPIPVLTKSETLHELFNSLETYCTRKKKKGTVIFDEFQEVASIKDGNVIEREMRSAFQHHKNVSYAFLGSKQNLLKGIFKNKNRPFYNFGRHFEIDVIQSDHWKDFIAKRLGQLCPKALIGKIPEITENHPYYTQMLCHYLWDHAKQNKCQINADVLEKVIQEIIERDTVLLAELWDRISISERHLLKAIAEEETGSLYETAFLLKHNLGSASSVQKAASKLMELDYIRKLPSGKIAFINPILKQWIIRNESPVKNPYFEE